MNPRDEASPVDVAAIRALCDAATPANWWEWTEIAEMMPGGDAYGMRLAHLTLDAYGDGMEGSASDRAFIAAMRTAAPAMLDEIERLREELAAEKRRVERVMVECEELEAMALRWAGLQSQIASATAIRFRAALADEGAK